MGVTTSKKAEPNVTGNFVVGDRDIIIKVRKVTLIVEARSLPRVVSATSPESRSEKSGAETPMFFDTIPELQSGVPIRPTCRDFSDYSECQQTKRRHKELTGGVTHWKRLAQLPE